MAEDFLNTQVDPGVLNNVNRSPINPTTLNTSEFDLGEIDPYVMESIESSFARKSPAVPNLFREDIFPTGGGPVTQQGFSGFGMSIPTIAPTGTLFPFGAVEKRKMALEEQALKEAQKLSYTPEFAQLADFPKNQKFFDSQFNVENQFIEAAKNESLKKYGNTKHWPEILQGSTGYNQFKQTSKNFADAYNQVFDMIQGVAADTENYYPPETSRAIMNFREVADEIVSDPSPEAFSKLSDISTRIIKQKNTNDAIKGWVSNIGEQTVAIPIERNDPSGDYDELATYSYIGNFFERDNDGRIIMDIDERGREIPVFAEKTFNDWFDSNYDQTYGRIPGMGPDRESMRKQARDAIKYQEEVKRSTASKYNLWKRKALVKEKRKTPVEDQSFIIGTTTVPMSSPMGGVHDEVLNESIGFSQKTDVDAPAGTLVKDRTTGEVYRIEETITFNPRVSGNATVALDESGNVVDFSTGDVEDYKVGTKRVVVGDIVSDKDVVTVSKEVKERDDKGKEIGSVRKQIKINPASLEIVTDGGEMSEIHKQLEQTVGENYNKAINEANKIRDIRTKGQQKKEETDPLNIF